MTEITHNNGDRVQLELGQLDNFDNIGLARRVIFEDMSEELIKPPIYGVAITPSVFMDSDPDQIDVVIEGYAHRGVADGWHSKAWKPAPDYEPSDETKALVAKTVLLGAAGLRKRPED